MLFNRINMSMTNIYFVKWNETKRSFKDGGLLLSTYRRKRFISPSLIPLIINHFLRRQSQFSSSRVELIWRALLLINNDFLNMIDALFAEDYSSQLSWYLHERKWYNFLYSRLHPKKVIQLFSINFTFLTSILLPKPSKSYRKLSS